MTSLDFDELHKLVDENAPKGKEALIEAVAEALKGAYERAVLDWELEFEYLFIYDPEMLEGTLNKVIAGETWRERISDWYDGKSPEGAETATITLAENKTEGLQPNIEAIKRVVDTEYHRMYETGSYDSAVGFQEETGTTVYKVWNTMLDERVRSTHSYIEADRVPLDRAFFTYDGDSAMFPGGFELPQNNIGCRCLLTYEIGE